MRVCKDALTVAARRIGSLGIAVAFCVSLLTTTQAHALTIDFATGALAGGLISLLPGNNITGTDIGIGMIRVTGAGAADGFYTTNASLAFDTSANMIGIHLNNPFTLNNGNMVNAQDLLVGSFASHLVLGNGCPDSGGSGCTGPFLSLQGMGDDLTGDQFLLALGIAPTDFTFFGFSMSADYDPNTNQGTVISTDIANNPKVPEPASLVLLGIGVAALGVVARRRRRS